MRIDEKKQQGKIKDRFESGMSSGSHIQKASSLTFFK